MVAGCGFVVDYLRKHPEYRGSRGVKLFIDAESVTQRKARASAGPIA